MRRINAREISYARVCFVLRPFRWFQLGDRYIHVPSGQEVGVSVLIQRAEKGRPAHSDDEHVWLPPLEHWCAGIAGQMRVAARRDLARWELEQRVLRAIADACPDYPTVSAAEVAARVFAVGAGVQPPPVSQTLPRIPASDWRR